jgi:hypothetical protein
MVRWPRGAILIGAWALALAPASARAADGAPCTIATKGDSPVAKACAQGGIPKAKAAMKEMAKKARAAGTKYECDDCHKDDLKYELTADAREQFAKLLAAAK